MYVLSENISKIKNFLLKFLSFTAEKKSPFIAWTSFRNVEEEKHFKPFLTQIDCPKHSFHMYNYREMAGCN